MSDDVLIQPLSLDTSDFPPLPLEPGFTDLVDSELGDQGTPVDGFDSVLEDLIAIVDSLDNGLALLSGQEGGDLDDTFAEILTVDPAEAGEHVANLQAALPDIQGNVDNLGNLLGAAGPPTPPSGGGGGPTCQATVPINAGVPVPVTVPVQFNNPTTTTYHVKSKTFTQETTGVFSESDNIPQTLPPGGSWTISITYQVHAKVGTQATFTVVTDAPNSPSVLCIQLVQSGGSGGGGHPSGGGPRR